MKTEVVKPTKKGINKAAESLASDGVIVAPSASSYGLSCDATNSEAVKKIFAIKQRDLSKKMLVVVSDVEMAKNYGVINSKAATLLERFEGEPLTLIVDKKKDSIPDVVNTDFVFRVAVHPALKQLVEQLGKPVVSTSANLSGNAAIYSLAKVQKQFEDKVDLILDAGDLERNPASTIVDARTGKVVREGAISEAELANKGALLS